MSSGSIFILAPDSGKVVLMSDPMRRQTSLQILLVLGDGLKFARSLNKLKSFFHFPIYGNILSAGRFKKLKRGFGTLLIFQRCEPTRTPHFPCPSGYGHSLLGMEMHKIYFCAWQKPSRMGQDLGTGFWFFGELTTPYISKAILVIMACTSDEAVLCHNLGVFQQQTWRGKKIKTIKSF